MSKSRAVLLAFAALVVGVVVGGFVAARFYDRFMGDMAMGSSGSSASSAVVVLRHIRAGDTNRAIEALELRLDGELIALQAFLDGTPQSRRDPLYVRTLERAREYRANYPHAEKTP